MTPDQERVIEVLKKAYDELPECFEQVVLCTMIGNIYGGASNEPLAEHAAKIARQMLREMRS